MTEIDEHEEDMAAYLRLNLGKGEKLLTDEVRNEMEAEVGEGERRIYISEMMDQKREEIMLPKPEKLDRVPWYETMVLTSERKVEEGKEDAGKDVERETRFHDATMDAVREGYRRLQAMGIPATRPADFYADMFKHDTQMEKVRARIAYESKAVEIVENRKKKKEQKKYAKQVQAEKVLEKMKAKAAQKNKVDDWKKKTGKLGKGADAMGEDDDEELNRLIEKQNSKDGKKKVNAKREAKNAKYGHGGKKRGLKRNDHASWAADLGPGKRPRPGKGRKGTGKKPRKNVKPGKRN